MSEISRRAKVCPVCHLPNSFAASVRGFIQTGGWAVTSCIAGWYGLAQHAEKVGIKDEVVAVQKTLETKSRELVAANFTKEALKKKWTQIASFSGNAYGAGNAYKVGNVGAAPDIEGAPLAMRSISNDNGGHQNEIDRLQQQLDDALKVDQFDERLVERLTSQIVDLQLSE